jgi:hypothetical protein
MRWNRARFHLIAFRSRLNDNLILRSTPQVCVSKDGLQRDWCPPFETPRFARLLRVRCRVLRAKNLVGTATSPSTSTAIILSSSSAIVSLGGGR